MKAPSGTFFTHRIRNKPCLIKTPSSTASEGYWHNLPQLQDKAIQQQLHKLQENICFDPANLLPGNDVTDARAYVGNDGSASCLLQLCGEGRSSDLAGVHLNSIYGGEEGHRSNEIKETLHILTKLARNVLPSGRTEMGEKGKPTFTLGCACARNWKDRRQLSNCFSGGAGGLGT